MHFRYTACYLLYSIIGIFFPALRTAKAVVNGDVDLMKEQLTYWTVSSIIGGIEMLCGMLGLYQNTPPEFRVLFVVKAHTFNGIFSHFIQKTQSQLTSLSVSSYAAVVDTASVGWLPPDIHSIRETDI